MGSKKFVHFGIPPSTTLPIYTENWSNEHPTFMYNTCPTFGKIKVQQKVNTKVSKQSQDDQSQGNNWRFSYRIPAAAGMGSHPSPSIGAAPITASMQPPPHPHTRPSQLARWTAPQIHLIRPNPTAPKRSQAPVATAPDTSNRTLARQQLQPSPCAKT